MAEQASETTTSDKVVNILVYSDNRDMRNTIIQAVGRKVGKNFPEIRYTEAATGPGAILKVEEGNFDLLILDAETPKLGGIGLGKQVRDEVDPDMPFIVLVGRPQDRWLARVAKPNAILDQPVNPRELAGAVKEILEAKQTRVESGASASQVGA